jgi:hypothetical protein
MTTWLARCHSSERGNAIAKSVIKSEMVRVHPILKLCRCLCGMVSPLSEVAIQIKSFSVCSLLGFSYLQIKELEVAIRQKSSPYLLATMFTTISTIHLKQYSL